MSRALDLEALLECGHRGGDEPHRRDEAGYLLVLRRHHGAGDVRALRPEVPEQRFDEPPPHAFFAGRWVDPEELHPSRRLFETELAPAHLAEHEPDDTAVDLGDLRRVGIAAEVVRGALLPDIGAGAAADATLRA